MRIDGFATPGRLLVARNALARVLGESRVADVTLIVGKSPHIEVELTDDTTDVPDDLVRATVSEAVAAPPAHASSAEVREFRDDTEARLAALTDAVAEMGEQIALLRRGYEMQQQMLAERLPAPRG